MSNKFSNYQKVIVLNLIVNGERRDSWGLVQRYVKDKVEVEVNSVFLLLTEDRLVDYDAYWEQKRKEENGQ
jgi:hypothetical protein